MKISIISIKKSIFFITKYQKRNRGCSFLCSNSDPVILEGRIRLKPTGVRSPGNNLTGLERIEMISLCPMANISVTASHSHIILSLYHKLCRLELGII